MSDVELRREKQRLQALIESNERIAATTAALLADAQRVDLNQGTIARLQAKVALLENIAHQQGWDIDLDLLSMNTVAKRRHP